MPWRPLAVVGVVEAVGLCTEWRVSVSLVCVGLAGLLYRWQSALMRDYEVRLWTWEIGNAAGWIRYYMRQLEIGPTTDDPTPPADWVAEREFMLHQWRQVFDALQAEPKL